MHKSGVDPPSFAETRWFLGRRQTEFEHRLILSGVDFSCIVYAERCIMVPRLCASASVMTPYETVHALRGPESAGDIEFVLLSCLLV